MMSWIDFSESHFGSSLRNKFDALLEISETPTPNDENENFVNAHLEVAAECIPT